MGSATTQALRATTRDLAQREGVDLRVASDLFSVARLIGTSSQLSGALADPAAPVAAREDVVTSVFGGAISEPAIALVRAASAQRWSRASEFVDGIEELAIRCAALAGGSTDIEGELFWFSRMVAANPELELALGSRLGEPSAKGDLVDKLVRGRVSDTTALIVSSMVQQPGERRVRQLLSRAMHIVSDQNDRTVATVTSAVPLQEAHAERLRTLLSKKYGRAVSLNTVIDPQVVGGLRVQVADDVIDASVASRLVDVRHRLAG
ncbi:F0F1 ATP synthase subunit delta [Microbacterium sp. LRZ72]|uniref:F0F1 ATP synthase subunit delta n=1 Tax=Microbacterium sp. LRZ72 TaxID=2942481 RepID=UPI0029A0BA67|nr:F0F1 ATP synthase subunit delta [Microbacterium sp. LRZ72]MDX2377362.1 F0F1 ATP synthase subunit delta [Microbacterium sp. LRZ72]